MFHVKDEIPSGHLFRFFWRLAQFGEHLAHCTKKARLQHVDPFAVTLLQAAFTVAHLADTKDAHAQLLRQYCQISFQLGEQSVARRDQVDAALQRAH